MMERRWEIRGMWLVLCVCVAIFIGIATTDAFAVVGKSVTVNVGEALAKTTLIFDMKEGPDVEVIVTPQGEATLPANVNKDTVYGCYRKVRTATGESKEKVECAGWLPDGGGAAAAASSEAAGADNWLRDNNFTDFRLFAAGGAGLSTTDVWGTASSNLGAFGNFSSMESYGRVPGGVARFGAELGLSPIIGIKYIFVGLAGSTFFGRSDSFGADLDPITPGKEATSEHKLQHAIDWYVGKRVPFHCGGRGECTLSGRVGGSLITTENSLMIVEASITQKFSQTNSEFAPYWGVGLDVPIVTLARGPALLLSLSADFRYISEDSMTRRSLLGFDYTNSNCSYVDFNPTAGLAFVW